MDPKIRRSLEKELSSVTGKELVAKLFDFIKQRGDKHYDEAVTQLQHALQCAQHAQQRRLCNELITAALLHDIGHLLYDEHDPHKGSAQQDMKHELAGAKLLSAWFPEQVTEPIRLHVAAKRYLCSTDPDYYGQLSPASRQSLQLQGGRLTPSQRRLLEQNPFLQPALELRHLDDLGKSPDMETPPIDDYTDIVVSCLHVKMESFKRG